MGDKYLQVRQSITEIFESNHRCYGYLGEHDLLRVRTDAEKFLLLAALNLVECVAYVGAQLQSK